MKIRKIFEVMILLSFLSYVLSGCFFDEGVKFSKINIGDTFASNRDGYCEKIDDNYCLYVELRSNTSLLRIPDEYTDIDWDSSLCDNNVVLKKHFIKCYYTSKYLVLCEEKDDDSLEYTVFSFIDGQYQSFSQEKNVYKLLEIDSIQWLPLCNTNAEIQVIK